MTLKKIFAVLLVAALLVSCIAGCGSPAGEESTVESSGSSNSPEESSGEESTESESTQSSGPDDTSEHYSYTVYYNGTGLSHVWGEDAASSYINELFNVDVTWTCADSDADAKLNLMMASDDLPECVWLNDNGANLKKLAEGGYLQPLDNFMYENNPYTENVGEMNIKLAEINGQSWYIQNWPRTIGTGGNYQWMIDPEVYEAVGSPDISTFEGLVDFMGLVKDAGLTSYSGETILPYLTANTDNGYYVWWPIFRSYGGDATLDTYVTYDEGELELVVESELGVKALKEANRWFREGYFTAETFTDSQDQFLEKLTNARGGLVWYDFSQDDTNNFRRIIQENSDSTYQVLGSSYFLPENDMFPKSVDTDELFGDLNSTVGGSGLTITKNAENGQRIFDVAAWQLTKDGSINMMYGPEGGMWEGLDENGNPNLLKASSEFTSEELDAAGAWLWAMPANADHVDLTKFAVNDKQSDEERNWVVYIQSSLTSFNEEAPKVGQKIVSNELLNLTNQIDPASDEGVIRQMVWDNLKQMVPLIIMAESDEQFETLLQEAVDFAHAQGIDAVLDIYNAGKDANIEAQGFSVFSDEYDVYKQNS